MSILRLKNFARIKSSNFEIKDITVLAGKPGTGKSYIMKLLYALDESFHKTDSELNTSIKVAKDILSDYNKFKETVMPNLLEEKRDEIIFHLKNYKRLLEEVSNTENVSDKNMDELLKFSYKNILESIFGNLNQISNEFEVKNEFVKLKYSNDSLIVNIVKSKQENWDIPDSVVFVETPLIVEFKQFMKRAKGKTPYHIESLLNILDKDYSFTNEKQDEFIKSFIAKSIDIIGGTIVDEGDGFIFKTNSKDYNIVNASSGTKSIGLLQYLVANKAIKKDSILLWEEPEVHLHPSWQLKMIDLFIELMHAGVKVVFSTHSPFMADFLNAKAQKEGFRDRVSYNLLSENKKGVVSNTILNDDNWKNLQDELLGPLEDVMWQYL